MTCNRQLRITLLGASLDSTNLGVSALASAAIKCIDGRFPGANISLLDYDQQPSEQIIALDDRKLRIRKVNIRFSKRLYLPNNIAILILLALVLRTMPFYWLRNRLLVKNKWLRYMQDADVVFSIAGGDSFAETYGFVRMVYVALPQVLSIVMGKRLLLLPQTIGPFRSLSAKTIARFILKHAEQIYARDQRSIAEIETLLKGVKERGGCRCCYDVAFVLDANAPKKAEAMSLFGPGQSRPLIGLNVSGLLYNGGYTRDNMFRLRADYKTLIHRVIDFFIVDQRASVQLIPHVVGTVENPESDCIACERVCSELVSKYGEALRIAPGPYNQNEVKYLIGRCDFFVGSRMHSCISAVSECVPAVSIAYSDKFKGVMDTIGDSSTVADARALDEDGILCVIRECYEHRERTRRRLIEVMPKVKNAVMTMLDSVVSPLN